MLILGIETATEICSVAIFDENKVIIEKSVSEKNAHSAVLTLLIEEVMCCSAIHLSNLNAIAVSEGPGSYTGLRIGYSTAKGLCFGLDLPLIIISTLQSMAHGLKAQNSGFERYIPMIDARRMEVYAAVFDSELNIVVPEQPFVLDENSFISETENLITMIGGSGSEKFAQITKQRNNLTFVHSFQSSAKHLQPIAVQKFREKNFADLIHSEPNYIKAFYTTKC